MKVSSVWRGVLVALAITTFVPATWANGAAEKKAEPLALPASAWTLAPNPQLLVSATDLVSKLNTPGLVVLDARPKGDFEAGHVPGSVSVIRADLEDIIKVNGTEYSDAKSAADIKAPLQKAGINQDSKVVIVGDASSLGPRLFWVLDYYGLKNVAVLDGGFAGWKAAGGSVSTSVVTPPLGNVIPVAIPTRAADYNYVKASIGSNSVILCNALAEASFKNEAIAGSVSLPQDSLKQAGGVPYFKGADELKSLLISVGYTPDKELVFYCGGGGAASVDYFAARLLGTPKARVYDGSVAEWKAKGEILPPGGIVKASASASDFSLATGSLNLIVNDEFLVAQADLAKALADPKTILIDARPAEDFAKGALPGAINIDPRKQLDKSIKLENGNEVAAIVLDANEIKGPLQSFGISADSRVIVYDGGIGYLAARIFWVLDYYGHSNVSVLDGGVPGYLASGKSLVAGAKPTNVGTFVPKAIPDKIATYEYVKAVLGTDATLVCDALAKDTFAAGAIPGSVNLPFTATIDDKSYLKKAADLYSLLQQVGYNPGKELVFYCGAGYAASQNYFIARYLGLAKVRNYDGSKRDWTAHGEKLTPNGAKI